MQAPASYTKLARTSSGSGTQPRRPGSSALLRRIKAYIDATQAGSTPRDAERLLGIIEDLRNRADSLPRRTPPMTTRKKGLEILYPQLRERGVLFSRRMLDKFGVNSFRKLTLAQMRELQAEITAA